MTEKKDVQAATQDSRIIDLAIRLMFLGLFVYSAIVMVTPLASIFIWAVILCVAIYPLFDWLQKKLGGRKGLSATILVLIGLVLTLGPIASAVSGAADLGSDFSEQAAAGTLKLPPPPKRLGEIPVLGPRLVETWSMFEKNLDGALAKYGPQLLDLMRTLFGKVLGVGVGLLGFALSVIVMGVLLSPGPSLVVGVQKFANRVFAPRGAEWCCQTNANQSLQGQYGCPLCRAKTAPLGESGGAVQLESRSGSEAALRVEMVADRGMNSGEFL